MPSLDFLHRHRDYSSLLRIVAVQMAIDPVLVAKYYGSLQRLGLALELKGGTS